MITPGVSCCRSSGEPYGCLHGTCRREAVRQGSLICYEGDDVWLCIVWGAVFGKVVEDALGAPVRTVPLATVELPVAVAGKSTSQHELARQSVGVCVYLLEHFPWSSLGIEVGEMVVILASREEDSDSVPPNGHGLGVIVFVLRVDTDVGLVFSDMGVCCRVVDPIIEKFLAHGVEILHVAW